MKHHLTTAAAAVLIFSAQSAQAQDSPFALAELDFSLDKGSYSLDAGVSSFGQTVTAGYRINDSFGLRMPIGCIGFEDKQSSGNASVEAKLSICGAGLIADYYPFEQIDKLRLSGGIMAPKYKYTLKSKGDLIEVNGEDYNVNVFDAKVHNKGLSPYLGIGYRLDATDFGMEDKGWGLSMDLGAMFNLNYSAHYSYDKSNLTASQIHLLETEVNKELHDFKTELNDNASVVPWISIAASYNF